MSSSAADNLQFIFYSFFTCTNRPVCDSQAFADILHIALSTRLIINYYAFAAASYIDSTVTLVNFYNRGELYFSLNKTRARVNGNDMK